MSARPKRDYRATVRAIALEECAKLDQRTKVNVNAVITAYHEQNVAPLLEWVALPWWKRLFRAAPVREAMRRRKGVPSLQGRDAGTHHPGAEAPDSAPAA